MPWGWAVKDLSKLQQVALSCGSSFTNFSLDFQVSKSPFKHKNEVIKLFLSLRIKKLLLGRWWAIKSGGKAGGPFGKEELWDKSQLNEWTVYQWTGSWNNNLNCWLKAPHLCMMPNAWISCKSLIQTLSQYNHCLFGLDYKFPSALLSCSHLIFCHVRLCSLQQMEDFLSCQCQWTLQWLATGNYSDEHIQKPSRWGKTICSLTLTLIILKKEQYNGYRNSALVFWWFSSAMDRVKIADIYNLSEGL